MTISTIVLLYSLSIIAGIVLVVYGLSIQPRKKEQLMGSAGPDVLKDTPMPIDGNLTLQSKDDSSGDQEALDRDSIR
jgi:hypothetical protein